MHHRNRKMKILHTTHCRWGIYHVFNLYENREATEMRSMTSRVIIWSWYIGAIIGTICAGFALQKIRKNRIYVSIYTYNFTTASERYIVKYMHAFILCTTNTGANRSSNFCCCFRFRFICKCAYSSSQLPFS